MSGDTEVTSLLLARGVKASAEALLESVTFNNAATTQALLDAGADATISESSGVTLLHWAVITNRPTAIPLLVAAGADVNAKDEAGFTPLIQAFLKAGASRQTRKAQGRTPRQQALHQGHQRMAEALK